MHATSAMFDNTTPAPQPRGPIPVPPAPPAPGDLPPPVGDPVPGELPPPIVDPPLAPASDPA
ncbi:MAG TPA: hypothetical protein VIW70_07945 [Rubrivivax sp.]